MSKGHISKGHISKGHISKGHIMAHSAELEPTRADRLKRLMPVVVTTISGIICYGLFYRRGIWLSVVAYGVAPAERVLNGEVPYRDFFFNYTPGMLWLNAGLMKAFGVTLLTVNSGIFFFKLAGLISLFFLARKVTTDSFALMPVALALAWLGHRYIFNVHPAQYYSVFAIVAAIVMLDYADRGGWYRLVTSGLLVGVVFLFKYNVGLAILVLTMAVPVAREMAGDETVPLGRRLAKAAAGVLIYCCGFGLILAALVLFMAENQAFRAMIDHFMHHASDYAEERAIGLPSPRSALLFGTAAVAVTGAAMLLAFNGSKLLGAYVVVVIALVAGVVLAPGAPEAIKTSATASITYLPLVLFGSAVFLVIRSLGNGWSSGHRLEWWKQQRGLIVILTFSLAVYLEVFPRADYYHLIRVLPLCFVLFALLLKRWSVAMKLRSERREARASWVLIPAALLLLVGIKDTWQPQFDGFHLADNVPLAIERGKGLRVNRRDAEFIDSMAGIIASNSAGDDSIFSFARRSGGFYFLAARRNPTRLLWWDSVGIAGSERETLLQMVLRREFKLVLVQDALTDDAVRGPIESNYHQIGHVSDIAVFDRNQ